MQTKHMEEKMWEYIGAAAGRCIIHNPETGETQDFMDYEDAAFVLAQLNGTTFPSDDGR